MNVTVGIGRGSDVLEILVVVGIYIRKVAALFVIFKVVFQCGCYKLDYGFVRDLYFRYGVIGIVFGIVIVRYIH